MRVSRAQALSNRRRSVTASSRLFRGRGYDGVGLMELMKAAGFSHGAFYGQFESKAEVISEATQEALADGVGNWRAVASGASDPLTALARFYLSIGHRNLLEEGCALAALAGDAPRQGPEVREAFTKGINDHLSILTEILPPEASEDDALRVLSTMVGALLLARATADDELSKRILDVARASITNEFSSAAGRPK